MGAKERHFYYNKRQGSNTHMNAGGRRPNNSFDREMEQTNSTMESRVAGRFYRSSDKKLFLKSNRSYKCLYANGHRNLKTPKLDNSKILDILCTQCQSIEHQILRLREETQITLEEYLKRYKFTQQILDCLYRHHEVVYEALVFGSSMNGLGFKDSDIDLRLRPLRKLNNHTYEPDTDNDGLVDRVLRDIAYQTTRCSPAIGEFVPSSRCPLAKLTFFREYSEPISLSRYKLREENLIKELQYDISLASSSPPLGIFNTLFLRFLCDLEPKFHLLAIAIRYWSKTRKLIVRGRLSSYALVNMLVYFCQTLDPPLLPTVDYMRKVSLKSQDAKDGKNRDPLKCLTQIEWQCIVCLDVKKYKRSTNSEPLGLLLLKFFEFYLKFPYETQIITIRPGEALTHNEFKESSQFHPNFPIKQFLNIQDPFELSHNLTTGMNADHFKKFIETIRMSYDTLFEQLMNNYAKPSHLSNRRWGIAVLFYKTKPAERSKPKESQKQ